MRLICPNCSAQYEIDTALVPDEGRDVQCSNCGHTWFELPPPPEEFTEQALSAHTTEDASAEADDNDAPSHAALAIAAASEDEDDDEDYFDRPAPPPITVPAKRRPVDAADVDVLKEEAERELSRRRAPPSEPMETQTDLGLAEIRDRRTPSRALRARMAHLNEGGADAETKILEKAVEGARGPTSRADVISDASDGAPRRDLLPDIDEINSTLKSTGARTKANHSAVARQRKGFRFGFLIMALLAVLAILVYAQAPAIARAVPGSEGALIPYVDGANAVRDWVDGLIAGSN
ncbi:zinc-ribbon domain-containing protein [Rhodobacteraceae bacterium]|nr:zinc-ribbon domain-containing protein [Paracoccaceae bacterium]